MSGGGGGGGGGGGDGAGPSQPNPTGLVPTKSQKGRRKISLPWFRQTSVTSAHAPLSRQHTIDSPGSFRFFRQPSSAPQVLYPVYIYTFHRINNAIVTTCNYGRIKTGFSSICFAFAGRCHRDDLGGGRIHGHTGHQ